MIIEQLTGLETKAKANLKAREIAGFNHVGIFTDSTYGIRVQILELKAIDNGVEVLARAWKGGVQLGFGPDGSVDIERFRIFNPPILVPDSNGDIVRSSEDGARVSRLREDPQEAIRQCIAHTAKVAGKETQNITPGKIGNTTSTFFPDANVETTTFDGYARIDKAAGAGISWASARGATSADGASDTDANLRVALRGDTVSNMWRELARSIMGFDTSTIPDSDSISSAVLSIYDEFAATNPTTYSLSVVVDKSATPASATAIAVGDFNTANWANTLQSDTADSFSNYTGSAAYRDFTFNATGRGNINKTGVSWFGIRSDADRSNTEPTWSSNTESSIVPSSADAAGTTKDPKLVVTHASSGGGVKPHPTLLTLGVG